MITRIGRISRPHAPRIHLGAASAKLISSCLTATDKSGDVGAQTTEILMTIDRHLTDHGSARAKVLMAQVWLADIRDLPGFRDAWNAWIDPDHVPALSVVQAAASRRDSLVEIRAYAAR